MRAVILAGFLILAACGEPTATVTLDPGGLGPPAMAEPGATAEPDPEAAETEAAEPSPDASSQGVTPASPLTPGPATETPEPEPSPTGPRELGADEDAEIGRPYRYNLYTHCGITTAWWNGAWWNAMPPQDDGSANPPPGWGNPHQSGVIVQVSETRLEFTGDQGQRADFVPRPESEGEPPPCY